MANTDIVISAPGKVILHGEHAVVYRKTALVASLQKRTYLCIQNSKDQKLSIELPELNITRTFEKSDLEKIGREMMNVDLREIKTVIRNEHDSVVAILYIYCKIRKMQNAEFKPLTLTVKSELTLGAGLGSSASFSVTVSAGFLRFFNVIENLEHENLEIVNEYAYLAECMFHGKPSGADNTTCCYGGLRCFGPTKSAIDNLPERDILLINTKIPRSTRVLVQKVRDQYEMYPEIVIPILNSIDGISKKCYEILSDVDNQIDESILSDLIVYNQKLLEALQVSHPKIEEICKFVNDYGLSAKLTGAGGGGCVFAVIPRSFCRQTLARIESDLVCRGFEVMKCSLGGDGVREENSSVCDALFAK